MGMHYNQIEWIDVSLDEIEDMTPPELAKADPEVSHVLYQKRSTSGGFWKNRSGLEKALLVVFGVCGTVMVAGGSYYAAQQRNSGGNGNWDQREKDNDVCVTSECTVAAGGIIATMDQTADPCEDFFQFACGGWIANNEIPEGKSRWGKFYELRDKVDKAVRKIVEAPHVADEANAVGYLKDYYQACRNTSVIEKVGYAPFLEIAGPDNLMGGWPMIQQNWDSSKFSALKAAGASRRYLNAGWLVSSFVFLDEVDVSHNVLYLDQPDLALPRQFYLDTESYADYITAYKTFMHETAVVMARELGETVNEDELSAAVENVFQFEAALAVFSVADEDRRNATAMYNPFTLNELVQKWPEEWKAYFDEVFAETSVFINDEERIIVREPEYLDGLLSLLSDTPKNVVADYIYWRAVMSLADEGPQELVDIA